MLLAQNLQIEKATGDYALLLSDKSEILLRQIELADFLLPWQELEITGVIPDGPPDRYGRQPVRLKLAGKDGLVEYLLEKGWARLHPRPGDPLIPIAWRALEEKARNSQTGLWGEPAFAPKSASDSSLRRSIGTYQFIFGKVTRLTTFGNNTELKLDEDVTIRIAENVFGAKNPAYHLDFKSLTGRQVAIRGWLGEFRGLIVKVDRIDQIELLP